MSIAFLMRDYLNDEYKDIRSTLANRTAELKREMTKLRRMDRESSFGGNILSRKDTRIRDIYDAIAKCRREIGSLDEALRVLDEPH